MCFKRNFLTFLFFLPVLCALESAQPRNDDCSDCCILSSSNEESNPFTVAASFIYWKPSEENIELGGLVDPVPAESSADYPVVQKVIAIDCEYKPGFQILVGYNFCHSLWDSTLKYTWFHCTQNRCVNTGDAFVPNTAQGGGIDAAWGDDNLGGDEGQAILFQSAQESWNLKMDFLDWDIGKSYCIGTSFLFRPSFGLRAAWINQRIVATYENGYDSDTITNQNEKIISKNQSWAVGPALKLYSELDVGYGLGVFADFQVDLLYTQYTNISQNQVNSRLGDNNDSIAVYNPNGILNFTLKEKEVEAIRTHLDMDLGARWSMDCHNWRLDFALGYEFQVFFDQSMFWNFTDVTNAITPIIPEGNLYIHGLTLTADFCF